ncbi:verrucotoxin subunit beta-like [Salvelinus alpinus]|uniref:verrucotoxin subunit beta-like n=1 Tax=Salvelinus alpinus TaxID=8036 RepID=UPI0039FCC022
MRDPVSIPCGHSYCRECISTHWAQPGHAGNYVCPQCNKRFRTKPVLYTNAALAKVLQELQQVGFSPALPALSYAGPVDVACDICSGQKRRAVKSCLTCTVSYCELHVRQHYTIPALRRHTLADVIGYGGHKGHHGNTGKTERIKEERNNEDEVEGSVSKKMKMGEEDSELKKIISELKKENSVLKQEAIEKQRMDIRTADLYKTINKLRSDLQQKAAETERGNLEDITAGWVEVPALGRPIHPGMLYDCCSESFTPDNKIKGKLSLPFPFTETKVIETDSLQERFRALGLDQPIRTSFLSGLVDVGGAAEYLNHPLLHKGDYVTLHYKRTTRLDQLTSFLLEKVRRPEVIQQQTATHVVMAVTYGTQAFIVCKTNRTWTMSKVINKLKKMIQLLTAEDGAAQLAKSSGLTCTYYGDLETNRGDREITDLCESFPKLLGPSGEKDVPLRVWLCPLKNLYPAAPCVREISEDLQSRVEREMEHYRCTGTRCEEIVKHEWVSKVQDLKDKLIHFIDLIQQYLAQLQKLMGRVLVSVRSGVQDEKAVEEEMKGHDLSPFRMEATGQWLDDKQAELKFLESLDSKIRSKMVSIDQLQKVISNSKTDTVVCFTLTSLGETDLYLSSLKQHLDNLQTYSQTRPGHRYQHIQPWFKSEENKERVTTAARAFLDFIKVTKKLKFVATSIPDDSTPGASIRLYQGGRLVNSDYEAVSKPETVKVVDTRQSSVTLRLSPSKTGHTDRFRVEYRPVRPDLFFLHEEKNWRSMTTGENGEAFVISGLERDTQYQIRHRAEDMAGVTSEFSDITVTETGSGSEPGRPVVQSADRNSVSLTWRRPAEAAEGRPVLHYRLEYREEGQDEWVILLTDGDECVYSLTPTHTSCRVRVCAIYREGDMSEPSKETVIPLAADVTLDPDTAHCELILSDNGRRVTAGKNRKVPNNPQRFDGWSCILGKEGFRSGRHFWHVEVNIEVETNLPWPSNLKVLDVCVDIEERWVSFYNAVSRSHVYTITDMVFTKGERIYPLFRTYGRDKGLVIQELK